MTYYDAKREGIMLCYPFEEKRLEKWAGPVIVQPKLDGVRCRAVYDHERQMWRLWSSQLNEFYSVPHINKALQGLPTTLELDGELYCHGKSFEQIFSIVSREENIHGSFEDISLHVFDIVEEEEIQLTRTNSLLNISPQFPDELKLVPSSLATGLSQIMRLYDSIMLKGYEGIIVRHLTALYIRRRSIWMMKFKPKKEDWYRITGYKEEIDKYGVPKKRLGALICEGDDGTSFSVGTGFNAEQRNDLWKEKEGLKGKTCHVAYQHITPGRGVPRFPVFVRVIDSKGGLT